MSEHGRSIRYLMALLCSFGAFAGCAPARTDVPWWRGIPSNFMAKNSLEAEDWRIQHRGPPPAEPETYQFVVHAPLAAGAPAPSTGAPTYSTSHDVPR